MPFDRSPEYGSSLRGFYRYSAWGSGGSLGANSYFDVLITVPELPPTVQPGQGFVLVRSPDVASSLPDAWVSYAYRQDATTIAVRWQRGSGSAATIPAGEYDILLIL